MAMSLVKVTALSCVLYFVSARVYHGERVGYLTASEYEVSGNVFIVDENHLRIRHFTYDGTAPDAYFWVGFQKLNSNTPSKDGTKLADENGGFEPLGRYTNADVVLTLPHGRQTSDVMWISIWCEEYEEDFGHMQFPPDVTIPAPLSIGDFVDAIHEVSGDVNVVDSKTIVIKQFTYDGQGPDAYFVAGSGAMKSTNGIKLANDEQYAGILGRYSNEDITLHLPSDQTIHDFEWLSVYCIQYEHDFGHILFPRKMVVPPYFEKLTRAENESESEPETEPEIETTTTTSEANQPVISQMQMFFLFICQTYRIGCQQL